MTEDYTIHLACYYSYTGEAESKKEAIDQLKKDLNREGKLKLDIENLYLNNYQTEVIFDGNPTPCGSDFEDIELVTSSSEQKTPSETTNEDN